MSVLLPTHDRAHLLPRALASAFSQTLADLEVVVVDDGSTDATPEVLGAVADARLLAIRTPNRGVAAARNAALEAAGGRWVAFLDDDNEWRPTFLERAVAAAEGAGAGAAYCPVDWVDDRTGATRRWPERLPDGDLYLDLVERWHPFLSGVVVGRDALVEAGGFDDRLTGFEDYDLLLKVAGRQRFVAVGDSLVIRHDHHGPQATRDAAALARAGRRVARRHGAAIVRRAGWRRAARWRRWLAGIAALEDVAALRGAPADARRRDVLVPASRLARGLPWTGRDGARAVAALLRGPA